MQENDIVFSIDAVKIASQLKSNSFSLNNSLIIFNLSLKVSATVILKKITGADACPY